MGITGLCSLLLAVVLVPLVMIASPRFEAPRSAADFFYWVLLSGFWLSPFVFVYAFVLTAVRSDPADWRRGRRWFLLTLFYLVVAAILGVNVAGN